MEETIIFHKRGCEVLARAGVNPQGQPLVRMVRADSRRQWSVGEFRPKYPKLGTHWVIEAWCPPEKYGTQDEWEDARDENGISYLGPFPAQGDYESVIPVMDVKTGEFIDEPGEKYLQEQLEIIGRNKGLTRSQRWQMIQDEQTQAKEARMKKLREMIDDARPAFLGGEAVRKHAEVLEEAAKRKQIQPQTPGASLTV